MEIDLMGANRLKIALSKQELDTLSMDVEELRQADVPARRNLVRLLEIGRSETGFSPKGAKLFVEVYPDGAGGAVFYFTAMQVKAGAGQDDVLIEPVIFAFPDADALCDSAAGIMARYGRRVYKSSLYHYRREYRLIVYPLDYADGLIVSLFGEYGRNAGTGEVLAAYIDEHGERLIRDRAIDLLAEYFG